MYRQKGKNVYTESLKRFEEIMETITMALAKRDFDLGLLTGFTLESFHGSIIVRIKHKMAVSYTAALADARTKQPRQFKTYDAAVKALQSIGFQVTSLEGK